MPVSLTQTHPEIGETTHHDLFNEASITLRTKLEKGITRKLQSSPYRILGNGIRRAKYHE